MVNTQFLGAGVQVQGQGGSAGRGGEAEDDDLKDLADKDDGVQLAAEGHDQGIPNEQIHQQQDHADDDVSEGGLQIVDTVGGEGSAQQHKDGGGAELLNNKVQEHHDDIANLGAEVVNNALLAQIQLVHAQAHHNGDEHNAQNSVVDAEGGADVAGDDVQDDVQGVGAGGTGGGGNALDGDVEQAGIESEQTESTGKDQSDDAGQHEPADGLGGNTAKGGSLADLADGHNHRGEDHGNDNQLQRPDEQLATDVEKADGAFTACRSDILEQKTVDGAPCGTAVAEDLSHGHEDQSGENTGDHGNEHLNGELVAFIEFLHANLSSFFVYRM